MNFPKRIVRKGSPDPAVEELWDEDSFSNLSMNDHKHEERAVTKSTLSQRLANIFSKSNRETLNQVSEAIRGLDDSQLDGFHNRHTMPSRSDINAGTPLPASGDGAFIAQEIYGEDDQEHNVAAEYSEFSRLLTHVSAQLKSVQAGQAALGAALFKLLKAEEESDDDDDNEPTAEEVEKALAALRSGDVPVGLQVQSKSVAEIIETIMGASKSKSSPPSFRKAGTPPLHVRIREGIEAALDAGRLTAGQSIEAQTVLGRMEQAQRGALVKSVFGDSLRRACPAVRAVFQEFGVEPHDEQFVSGI